MTTPKLKKTLKISALLVFLVAFALAAYGHDTLACALLPYSDFVQIDKNIYIAPPASLKERGALLALIAQAQARGCFALR